MSGGVCDRVSANESCGEPESVSVVTETFGKQREEDENKGMTKVFNFTTEGIHGHLPFILIRDSEQRIQMLP